MKKNLFFITILTIMLFLSACGDADNTDFDELTVKLDAKTGKFGYVNPKGKVIIPYKYDKARDFNGSLAKVKLDGKYGYIDTTGQERIPIKYDEAEDFSRSLAKVKLNGKYGYIDMTGQELITIKYEHIGEFHDVPYMPDSVNNVSSSMAKVKLSGKYGFIDLTGKEIIPCQYDEAEDFDSSIRASMVKLNGKQMFINYSGQDANIKTVYKGTAKMDYVINFEVVFAVSKDDKIDAITTKIAGLHYTATKNNNTNNISINEITNNCYYQEPSHININPNYSYTFSICGNGKNKISNLVFSKDGMSASGTIEYVYENDSFTNDRMSIPLGRVPIRFISTGIMK